MPEPIAVERTFCIVLVVTMISFTRAIIEGKKKSANGGTGSGDKLSKMGICRDVLSLPVVSPDKKNKVHLPNWTQKI